MFAAFFRQRRFQRPRRPLHDPVQHPAEVEPALQRGRVADLRRLVVRNHLMIPRLLRLVFQTTRRNLSST